MSDNIWWTKISNSSRLVNDVTNAVLERKPVILNLDIDIPFYNDFIEIVKEKLLINDAQNPIKQIDAGTWENGTGAAELLLRKYCGKSVRDKYFPRKDYSPAQFLADSSGFQLNGYTAWISNIPAKSINGWYQFIREYYGRKSDVNKALFVLECTKYSVPPAKIKNCVVVSSKDYYSEFDYYVYCFLLAAEIKGCSMGMRQYIAELMRGFCKGEIELCSEMCGYGIRIAESPEEVLKLVRNGKVTSENEISAAVWKAQIKLLFPIVEQFRRELVEKHLREIESALPFCTPFGTSINEPFHLDLGNINTMCYDGSVQLNTEEKNLIQLYIDVRNDLAHMRPASFENLRLMLQ